MTKWLLVAGYTACSVVGGAVSARYELPARPFGIATGQRAGRDLVMGWGTGLAAPWPLIVLMWWVARADRPSKAIVSRLLPPLFLVGALSEKATYLAIRGEFSPAGRAVAVGNIIVPIVLPIVWDSNSPS